MAGESIWSSTEFVAAIVGAIVGGLISFGTQIVALRAAKKQRDEDQLYIRRTTAHSLIYKLIRMASSFHSLSDHIENSLKDADPNSQLWSSVQHIVNLPDRITFTSEEMSLLLALKESELLNEVMNLDLGYSSLLDAMSAYGNQRQAMLSEIGGEIVGKGQAQASLTLDQAVLIMPRMEALNELIDHIRYRSISEAEVTHKTLIKVHRTLDQALSLGFKLEQKAPSIK